MEMVQLNYDDNSPTESPMSNNELEQWAQNLEGDDDEYHRGYLKGWFAAYNVGMEKGKAALAVRLEEERLASYEAAAARGMMTEHDKGYIEGWVEAATHPYADGAVAAAADRKDTHFQAAARAAARAAGWARRRLEGNPKPFEVTIGGRATKKITRQRDKRSRRKRQRKRRKTQRKRK